MKNIRNLLKKSAYLLIIPLLFLGCENEEEPIEQTLEKQSNYKIEKLSYEDFELNEVATTEFKQLNLKKSTFSRQSYDSGLGFTVETDSLKYVENTITGVHSYNFPIVRYSLTANNLENLVLQSNTNGGYDAFIVEYGFSINDYNQLNKQFLGNTTTKYTPIDFDTSILDEHLSRSSSGWACTETWALALVPNNQGDLVGGTELYVWEWVLESRSCTYHGGGPGGGGGAGNSGPNGPNNGGGSNPSNPFPNDIDDSIITTPTNPDGTSAVPNILTNFLQPELTTAQSGWINSNSNADAVQILFDYILDNQSSLEAKNFVLEMIDVIREDNSLTDLNALNFVIEANNQNKVSNPFDNAFLTSVNQFMDINATASNPGIIQLQIYFSTKCAVLKFNHPDWSDAKVYWEASKDFVHIALDGFGMIPVVGEIADLTNGVLYLVEGDGVNATLSFAATVPIVGWGATAGKYVFKIIPSTIGPQVRLTWKVLANGTVYFGSAGSKLRKVLGITDSALHAHHLIPWAQRLHPVVQKAAKSGNLFHINEALNGIPRPSSLHLTGHSAYNTKTQQILNNLDPNASIDEAYDFVSGFASHIRTLITNNPNLNSGQIADLISYP
ncbi:AHH domain-containing protein [Formosa haliotis]|uniref:AHH domain-containing protein n=1 Tax=Formosa haliotis TaxID=1555194 RepID=UPI00082428A7|nr:AHH domain-containing protein [Formosa haliotis]